MSFGTGSYGRQNRGRSYAPSAALLRPAADPNIMDGLRPSPIEEVQRPLVADTSECKGVEPRELTPMASYNWTNDSEPTILVPGCPPIWQNRPTPFRVSRDSGVSFIDQNRHRVPQYPLLPLVLAVDHLSPEFDFSSIDIVTDRNNLRKLVRWIDGSISRDFRIDLQLSGSTVLFTRYESLKVETESWKLGYGRNFEQYTTKRLAGCENSTGHHRIISYDYGGLKLLVRFEVDACIHFDEPTQERRDRPSDQRTIPGDDPDDILAALQRMSIRSDDRIDIVSRGVLVPQSSLIEMSSKSERSLEAGIDWQEYFPQLFVSQTPHYYLGVHLNGQFRRIDARALNDSVLTAQQRKQQSSFDRLCALLKTIRTMVVAHGEDARLSLVYRVETKKLEVFPRRSMVNVLPDLWMSRFRIRVKESTDIDDKASAAASWKPDDSQLGVSDASDGSDVEEKPARNSDEDSD